MSPARWRAVIPKTAKEKAPIRRTDASLHVFPDCDYAARDRPFAVRFRRAASRPRRAASRAATYPKRISSGLTMHRCLETRIFGSPGAGSTTAVRSRTAVTHTRLPSTSAGKSGRITTSLSVVTRSRGIRRSDCLSDMTRIVSHLSRSPFGFWRKRIVRLSAIPGPLSGSPPDLPARPPAVLVEKPGGPHQAQQDEDQGQQVGGDQ